MRVRGQRGRAPRMRAQVGGHLGSQPAQQFVHPLGGHAPQLQQVRQAAVVSVEQLQQQVVGHVARMHAQLIGQALGELRGPLADMRVQFAQPAHQGRVGLDHAERG